MQWPMQCADARATFGASCGTTCEPGADFRAIRRPVSRVRPAEHLAEPGCLPAATRAAPVVKGQQMRRAGRRTPKGDRWYVQAPPVCRPRAKGTALGRLTGDCARKPRRVCRGEAGVDPTGGGSPRSMAARLAAAL